MKSRDFNRLPIGQFSLTDGIWNYKLIKHPPSENFNASYSIFEKLTGGHLFLTERKEKSEEGYLYPILSACISVGSLGIHSTDIYETIRPLKLLPRGSYKNLSKEREAVD